MMNEPSAEAASGLNDGLGGRLEMPSPTEADLDSRAFNAIWDVIKRWDVNVSEYYGGYCGATGSHVMLILAALRRAGVDA